MWRNSVNLSSNLLSLSKSNHNQSFFLSSNPLRSAIIFAGHGVRGGVSQTQLHSSSGEFPSSVSSLKLGFEKSEGERAFKFSSSAAVVGPSVATTAALAKAKDVAEAFRHYGRCYWELSKARLSMLVVLTSGAGFVLGSGTAIDVAGLCWTCTGTMMVAASASSLNQVFEKNNDARMKRTRQRPLPSGRISLPHAAIWASTIGVTGTTLLACKANMLAAGLAASNLALYAFLYTPLKQIHPVNTWVGAIVGAIPPLLGWAAASGQVSLNAMILPAALYFWQLPHFMALAYLCRKDYADGGFRMFSLADPSGQRTSLVALRNCLYLLPLGYLAYDWGITSGWFCLESTLLTLFMTAGAVSFVRDRTAKNARRMFHGSLLYLPVFMSGMLFHRLTDNQQDLTETNPVRLATETQVHESEGDCYLAKPRRGSSIGIQSRPPVAYASVAPFPFLPAPVYANSDV
ncbi:UbiA prenyltransferase family [Macleaya cordata]|uniref:Heme O synthase n=1 Tax=Macleaya cordata TaxID=56857 RepID=A0A200Q166_MACCD|nr:UbiA prenyltransferase family [Macleaya cordata]